MSTMAPPVQDTNVPLEADEFDDRDSVYGAGSDTTSVLSSIHNYRVANGRTYHSYNSDSTTYALPNDARENDRQDFAHNIYLMLLDNKLHLCPAGKDKPLGRVLDAGTGTGVWALDLADEHPDAQVVGTDLSPSQANSVPPNVEFFVDDLESPWTYHSKFDFVYMRMLLGAIKDWPKLFRQTYDNLNPGGWVELMESVQPITCDDGTLQEDSAVLKWSHLILEATRKLGAPMDSAMYHKQRLIDAGFVNVVQRDFKWPMNPWPRDPKHKEIGAWGYECISSGLHALSMMLFTSVLGWSVQEVELLLVSVRKEMKDQRIHAYWPIVCVYGQKPE